MRRGGDDGLLPIAGAGGEAENNESCEKSHG
jgi:hypothetical protein